ncbi:transcriptional regulator, TetR family [Tranquillimonas rosea]|uniref:Transcriptional regulator, TetR family n=1 Tax=Tranquillimonas rosea TaxID=641238 RepID=A0A1H9QB37_9RHOB|nr:TetR family transcriptional regulator C-terminal domain-containing protein [Tranquillimonas rosea]SER57385.1 transcriptional regulator, TetR family [Tranquillimonas rosea]
MDTLPPRTTRIQKKNVSRILEAALDVFSANGFRGATLEQIARAAGLSKPNLLYYFPSKEAIHVELLSGLMSTWLDPLRLIHPSGEPVEELIGYVIRKLEMSRQFPRESRLFANEIVQGAPRIMPLIEGELRELVEEKSILIRRWQDAGRLARMEPRHLIFSIWATTQHYADFDVQVRGILSEEDERHFEDARAFLETFYRNALDPARG